MSTQALAKQFLSRHPSLLGVLVHEAVEVKDSLGAEPQTDRLVRALLEANRVATVKLGDECPSEGLEVRTRSYRAACSVGGGVAVVAVVPVGDPVNKSLMRMMEQLRWAATKDLAKDARSDPREVPVVGGVGPSAPVQEAM